MGSISRSLSPKGVREIVLDNSVTMRWFLGDGKPEEMAYAGKVLEPLKRDSALVPVN